MDPELLTRDDFREACFKRDRNRCAICHATDGLTVHHIIERRLFPDGGYYASNGATLCEQCHLAAEMTTLSVEEIRTACGITEKILPPQIYNDDLVDKWGNLILENGQRMMGELFDDLSVQKILERGGVLSSFTKYVKYPRTYHLPWSEGATSDDRILSSTKIFDGKQVVVALKMDGENTSCYSDFLHARAINNRKHVSRGWIKNFHSQFGHDIPEGWRVCMENLYAKHTIHYKNLTSLVYGFSVWNEKNFCLSWDETLDWFALLGIQPIPVLYEGIWDEEKIKACFPKGYPAEINGDPAEGYVVRLRDGFPYREFRNSVAKFVSKWFRDQMKSNNEAFTHWALRSVIPNEIKAN